MTNISRCLASTLSATILLVAADLSTAYALSTLAVYFDVNDDAPESGVMDFTAYTWDMTQPYWNAAPDGTGPGFNSTAAWVNGNHAIFAAGTDAAGLTYGIDIASSINAASATIEDGHVLIRSGTLDTGSGAVIVNAGATLGINSQLRLNTTAGKVVLSGGTLFNTHPGQAAPFLGTAAGAKGLEIDGIGAIGYSDGGLFNSNQISIYFGIISGTGGTATNGGAGTLIKIGPDHIGIGGTDQGGVNSQSLFSFAKLVVKESSYHGRFVTINGQPQLSETVFGAVPLVLTPDAITLDGGGIGVQINTTLHPNRGVTVSPNGGYFDTQNGANLIVPGPVSGSGPLMIGNPATSTTDTAVLTLTNPNNVNTFSGSIVGIRGTLQLNSSLTVASLNDAPTNNATIAIAAGQTLTTGGTDGSGSWSGTINGAGGLTKVGADSQELRGALNYTGDTRLQGGTLSILSASLANSADLYLSSNSTFNLAYSGTDTIRSLYINNVLQQPGTWGGPGSGAQFTTSLISGTGRLGTTIGVPEPATPGIALAGLLIFGTARRQRFRIASAVNNDVPSNSI